MNGVDAIVDKVPSLVSAYLELIDKEVKWVLLRDTDCIPISKMSEVKRCHLNLIPCADKCVVFQDGYEFESSLFSNRQYLLGLLNNYYNVNSFIDDQKLNEITSQLRTDCMTIGNPLSSKLNSNLERQVSKRRDKIYRRLTMESYLTDISDSKVQYLLCKDVIDVYLERIHDSIQVMNYGTQLEDALNSQSIFEYYLHTMNSIADIIPSHELIIDLLR